MCVMQKTKPIEFNNSNFTNDLKDTSLFTVVKSSTYKLFVNILTKQT